MAQINGINAFEGQTLRVWPTHPPKEEFDEIQSAIRHRNPKEITNE